MNRYAPKILSKLKSYFHARLGMFDYKRGWMKGDCISCGKKNKMGINLIENRSNCFYCAYKKKPVDVLMEVEGFSTTNEVMVYLNAFEDAAFLETYIEELIQKPAHLPESFRLINMGRTELGESARNYMMGRGYNINQLALKGVGYCTSGKYAYRIIIPYYANGQLVYFNAREFISLTQKHKNPPIEEFGIGKSLLIYNIDALSIYRHVQVVESATNALTLGERCIGTGGKLISNYQMSRILSSSKSKYIDMILDPDAYKESITTCLKICQLKKIRLVQLPEGCDVNDIGKKETMRIVKSTPYGDYGYFYKLKLDYEGAVDSY